MSKQTETNLFMVSSRPGFYQRLLRGVVTYQELGNRIVREIKTAQAFRQVDTVRELSRLLINIPIREYQLIAQYYLVWCQCRELKYHTEVLESIIDQTQTYKANALTCRGTFEWYKGNNESALYFYTEALKASPTVSEYVDLSRAIAVLKAQEGFHKSALKDLENLIPIIRHAEPIVYCDVLNSYAVELNEVGRLQEANNVSSLAVASPFSPYYPEWQETHSEIDQRLYKSRSSVTVSEPVKKPKPEPRAKVLKFQKRQQPADELDIAFTPMQMLGIILKVVLKDRITDEEVDRICAAFVEVLNDFYE